MEELKVIALTFTNHCNLNCIHCGRLTDSVSLSSELPASFFLNILDEAQKLGAEQVNITGGEIFARGDCMDLISGAYKYGFFVSIETNGTLLKKSDINQLSNFRDYIRISVSVDGVDAETHDAIRGKGTFAKTVQTLEQLSRANIPTRVITVLHRNNLTQIPQMVHYFVDKLKLGFRLLPNIIEYGRGVYACNSVGVTYDQIIDLMNKFYFDFLRQQKSDTHSVELNVALVPIDIYNHHLCPWGQQMMGVGPTGIASLCHVSYNDPRFIFGDLTKNSLSEVWRKSEVLARFQNMNPDDLHGVCGNCQAREICRGGCRLHAISKYGGDFLAPDPQCQVVYELDKFPEYALQDETLNCHYPIE